MITKPLILTIFGAASMQRWNDKVRPVELTELDKQAHKMVIAYVLAKLEEGNKDLKWINVIEGGLFEFLQRIVVTDLKPQIFRRIKEDNTKYKQLSDWAYSRLEPAISPLGDEFCRRFRNYFLSKNDDINRRILSAAHSYASKWEFDIIERANPEDYEIGQVRNNVTNELERHCELLKGMKDLTLYSNYRKFVAMCGQLRFQLRWSHLDRMPRTSVLGHMLIVAILSYLFSFEVNACERRCVNNYCTGLFHDFPEVLTRDISSPVKNSIKGLSVLIRKYEKEQMNKEVYSLIPENWRQEIKMLTEREFESVVTLDRRIERKSSSDINKNFNKNEYNPRDGEFVKAADDLAAFVEAYLSKQNGLSNPEFDDALSSLKRKYRAKTIAGINLGQIYAGF